MTKEIAPPLRQTPADLNNQAWSVDLPRLAVRTGILLAEVSLMVIWAMWVGRAILDLDPRIVPGGREFLSAIQSHHLWTRFQECGWCALWDGSERGGFPAFADTLGSALHPLVIATTLWLGVIDGAKIALVGAILAAGFAQWWLAREMRLGLVARIWAALLGMVSGDILGCIENGNFSIVLATAMIALTLAPSLWLARTGSRRAMVSLAVTSALAVLGGQGYLQVAMLFLVPAYLILIVGRSDARSILFKFMGAGILAILLTAPLLVPLAHFSPNLTKDIDASFKAAQPLPYYLLNLFIDDSDFLHSTVLAKLPYPYLYDMFLGWIPVGLAALCLALARPHHRRVLVFLGVYAGSALLLGSMLPLEWLAPLLPVLTGLRYAPFIGGIALPAIIGLSAYAVDRLLRLEWPGVALLARAGDRPKSFSLKWVVLIPLLFVSVRQGYDFSQHWTNMTRLDDGLFSALLALKTPDLQWVEPPFGEHQYIEPGVGLGLKLSSGILTYGWRGRTVPQPVLQMDAKASPPGMTKQSIVVGIPVYAAKGREYAVIEDGDGQRSVCAAQGVGGAIDVTCDADGGGVLTIQENAWDGWQAETDGQSLTLEPGPWLSVTLPAGAHTVQFRYRPWDVPLGLLYAIIGLGLCLFWIL